MTRPDEPTPPAGPWAQQPPPSTAPWGQQPPTGPWDQQPPAPGGPGPVDWDAVPPPQQPPLGYWPGQPQPGPYGPTGAYGVPAAPPTGMSTTKIVLITVGGVLALVGVIAVLLVVSLRRGDVPVAAPPTRAPATSAPAATVAPDDLVAVLPVDLSDCVAGETAGDGDLAAATCGPADTQPGPAEADFHLYPDVDTLDEVLLADADDLGLAELPVDVDCSTEMGYGEWTYGLTGETGGLLACGLTDDGRAVVAWTDDEFLVEGALLAPGTTQADVSALFDWWTEHSDYTG